jgi:hypothetical protein
MAFSPLSRVLALAALAAQATAGAATVADIVPPPGLYRVEVDGTIMAPDHGKAAMRQTTGASGDTVARQFGRNGEVVGTISEKGRGPLTQCIKPVGQAQALASLAAMRGAGACVAAGPGVIENGSLVTRQKCPFGEFTYTLTKVDKVTWEYRTEAMVRPVASGGAMMANMKFMRTMLENAKKNAASAKEREEAAAALAELDNNKDEMAKQAAEMDAMQPEIDKMRAEAGAVAGGGQGMASVGVTRLTRIADTCTAPTR